MRNTFQFKWERFLISKQKLRKYFKRKLFLQSAVWIRSRILHLMRMDLTCIDVTDPRIRSTDLISLDQFEFVVVNKVTLHVLSGAAFSNIEDIPATMLAQSSIWDPIYGMNDFGLVPKNPPKFDSHNFNLMAVPHSKNYFHWVIVRFFKLVANRAGIDPPIGLDNDGKCNSAKEETFERIPVHSYFRIFTQIF